MNRPATDHPATDPPAHNRPAHNDGRADRVDLLLSAGRGPQECAWAVAELVARLEADAAGRHLAVQRLDAVPGERRDTWRSVLVRVSGPGAGTFAGSWTGTVCWQAPSPYRAGSGRKNWYVNARRCDPEPPGTRFAETDVDVVACRTGGPGGQHRDKASTAARATHRPTGLVVVVDDERRFETNRRLALERLRHRLAETDAAADRASGAARRRMHDEIVRGNPVRVERPDNGVGDGIDDELRHGPRGG